MPTYWRRNWAKIYVTHDRACVGSCRLHTGCPVKLYSRNLEQNLPFFRSYCSNFYGTSFPDYKKCVMKPSCKLFRLRSCGGTSKMHKNEKKTLALFVHTTPQRKPRSVQLNRTNSCERAKKFLFMYISSDLFTHLAIADLPGVLASVQ